MSGNNEDGEAAVRLSEMICARVCHDLSGAVGAVGSGAELLADELGIENEALTLLVESAAAAGSRLRLLRQALSGGGLPIQAEQLRRLVSDYLASSPGGAKPTLAWRDCADNPWESGDARMLLNLVLLAQDSLPRGGAVQVNGRPSADLVAVVVASGKVVAAGEAVEQLADSAPVDFGPRGAQGRYARRLADQLGLAIRVEKEEDRISFVVARTNK